MICFRRISPNLGITCMENVPSFFTFVLIKAKTLINQHSIFAFARFGNIIRCLRLPTQIQTYKNALIMLGPEQFYILGGVILNMIGMYSTKTIRPFHNKG